MYTDSTKKTWKILEKEGCHIIAKKKNRHVDIPRPVL